MIPDGDIITATGAAYGKGSTYILGASIHCLIKEIEKLIECRKTDLLDKKPGALLDGHPKIIWVHMLRRPLPRINISGANIC